MARRTLVLRTRLQDEASAGLRELERTAEKLENIEVKFNPDVRELESSFDRFKSLSLDLDTTEAERKFERFPKEIRASLDLS